MKKPTSFSITPDLWGRFLRKARGEGRQASPVMRSLIDAYLEGKYNPYKEEGIDWKEQSDIVYKLEELR